MSLSQIFAYPNIQTLVKEDLNSNNGHRLGIVPLRTGGCWVPLFLVHDGFGEVLTWGTQLIRYLDEEIPVYGLAAEPPDDSTLRTVEGMAARLIQAIHTIQPKGPYRIAGWSFGGLLAYEIAMQLIGNNDEVQFLGLLDSVCNSAKSKNDTAHMIESEDFLDNAILKQLILRQNPSSTAVWMPNTTDLKNLDALWGKHPELSIIFKELEFANITESYLYFSRMRLFTQAGNTYEINPINIPIHLFIAQERSSGEPLYGWDKVLPFEHIFSVSIPGNHLSMMEEPNIATLGAELSRCIQERSQTTSLEESPSESLLVPIHTALRTKGSIFCIPGAGGNVTSFIALADALSDSWQIYGFQPRGLNGTDVPHSTVSAAASAYLRSIEEICPAEPVHLLGHSFGGWVAFEMALRLQASGRSPSSLTLIDSEAPHTECGLVRECTRVDVLMKLVEIWEMTAERSLNISRQTLEMLTPTEQLSILHKQAVQARLIPQQTTPDLLIGTIRTLAAALRTHYYPGTAYTMPANLILLADSKFDRQAQEEQFMQVAAGWQRWAPKLEVWRGPGNHMTALRLPDVRILASWLSSKLNAISRL
jgi:arthrofactin-type cyclic lipopeptide synthetase C